MNPIINNLGSLTRELLSSEIRCEPETAQDVCYEAGIPYTGAGLLTLSAAFCTKPTRHQTSGGTYEDEPENMSIFIEADTGDKYFYDAGTHAWTEYGSAGE